MLYPSIIEQKLGFDQIRQILRQSCLSDLGQRYCDDLAFSSDPGWIIRNLGMTVEFRKILDDGLAFPFQDYYDMIPLLNHLRIEGTYPEPDLLAELRLSLATIRDILHFLTRYHDDFPLLAELSGEIDPAVTEVISGLIKSADRILNEKGQIRDDASPELLRLRKEMKSLSAMVEKKILQTLKAARQNGWAPEESEVTLRNGRLVIPLVASHKRKIQGFVHDESATGQTVYLEPAELFEANNELRELELAERREIIRILTVFADGLRPWTGLLTSAYLFLGRIDFIRSKALFAIDTGGCMPTLAPRDMTGLTRFDWRDAIHPLLFLSHRRQGKKVIPLRLELSSESRIMVISGPNAGGKSVCLKTVGLLQYMLQCGILPTLREDSSCSVFDDLFLDIGDEQSIDNDLSTYSSRLINLKHFLEHLDGQSLFLIDEMGAGTDPALGGAIAEAALERLAATGATGIVTTHYSNLKLLAGRVEGIVNGAMLYDTRKLKPLFRLQKGKPGSSFAFEIAAQVGFPTGVLQAAKEKTGTSQLNFERQMQDLETEKEEIARKEKELAVADEFIGELIRKYEQKVAQLEQSRTRVLEEARARAMQVLSESNKIIEKTVKEIRESQADKEKTRQLRNDLNLFREKVGEGVAKPDIKSVKLLTPEERPLQSHPNTILREMSNKLASFDMTLDLRGKRVDEAFGMLQRFIDEAIMLSVPVVRILHGKGNGVLRQVTRDYARGVREIKSAKDESLEAGGAGVTVIVFR